MEKIILHAHSEWSHDSDIKLTEWIDFMRIMGISKLYLTEHEESGWDQKKYNKFKTHCHKFSTPEHQIIPGMELNIRGHHILAPNLKSYKNRPQDNNLNELKTWIKNQGTLLIAAHPDKYKNYDSEVLEICNGIELINTKPQYNWLFYRPSSRCAYLKNYYKLKPFIGQDIHKLNQYNPKAVMFTSKGQLLDFFSPLQEKKATLINDNFLALKNILLSVYKICRKKIRLL